MDTEVIRDCSNCAYDPNGYARVFPRYAMPVRSRCSLCIKGSHVTPQGHLELPLWESRTPAVAVVEITPADIFVTQLDLSRVPEPPYAGGRLVEHEEPLKEPLCSRIWRRLRRLISTSR